MRCTIGPSVVQEISHEAEEAARMPLAVVTCDPRYDGDLGTFGRWLRSRGFTVERVSRLADIPTDAADGADLLVMLGSDWSMARPMMGPADHPRAQAAIDQERELVRRRVTADQPTLGICFGGQLLCDVLGGVVEHLPGGLFLSWDTTEASEASMRGPWFFMHEDHFEPPHTAQRVAHAEHACVAFRHGKAWGLQFHPEADADLLRLWFAPYALDPSTAASAISHAEVNAAEIDRHAFRLYDHIWAQMSGNDTT